MISQEDYQIAPCLECGVLSDVAREAVSNSRKLGDSAWATITRSWAILYMFRGMETAFSSGCDPVPLVRDLLNSLSKYFDIALQTGFSSVGESNRVSDTKTDGKDLAQVEFITGTHYGKLFQVFSDASYWDEPVKLLRKRLERNDISMERIVGKKILDAGCGGGRYTVAWKLLGADHVTGVDVSEIGIASANKRIASVGISDVAFRLGNVLSLPFTENSFDIVFSNGVLHHTVDWRKGIHELIRVLKPGGFGWLYLIENPGGLFWDVIEILRLVMKGQDKELARQSLSMLDISPNRIFYMLDHVMVPINIRLESEEIEYQLNLAGAFNIRRLKRGADFDRVEQIYQNKPFAPVMYGVGENRYIFSK